ncbi:sensor histidine kinase [Antarctobacter sp.]|uniref:sensor histidine kinase n=1 Tax=Antarctobacter sp. TaxID=1872577 RepID=UPI002B26C6E9|nr:sensor histidine kinase [Antarctobacter sp.]
MSLRLRLFLLILSPLLLVSVLLGIWRFAVAQATAEDLFDRGLLAAALAISRDVAISEGDALSPRTRTLISNAGGGEVFYHVTGPGGIYVTGYAYPPAWRSPEETDEPRYKFAEYRKEPVRVLRMAETTTIGNLTGKTIVTVWQRMSDRNAFAADLARRAFAMIAALTATIAVLVWFGVDIGLRPLRGLHDAIERRSPDDLSRIQRAVPTEVTGIVATLNRLFGQVDQSIQTHQAFISDAAHQLRNPASALLVLAEALPNVSDPDEKHRREQDLIHAARTSARLAEQLLSLERLRHGGMGEVRSFDLNAMVEAVCADVAPDFLGRDLAFSFDPSQQPLPLRGDPVLIGEAVRNLIDNTLRHAGPDLSKVTVRLARDGSTACITVKDDGMGLPPDAEAVIFRRFGQLKPSEGSGLGLSFVQEVARLHGGRVAVSDDKGASFTVHLPLGLAD